MRRENIVKSIKITLAVLVAILISGALNMEFHRSVATIVIVSMLSNKRQSIKLAGALLFAAIISLGLASLLFTVFGYSLIVFGVYILIFTFLMYKFDTKSAIISNVVLVMHIYSLEQITVPILLNEFSLMFLGISVALAFNMFTIDIKSELVSYQNEAEEFFESILKNMGKCLKNECENDLIDKELKELNKVLSKGKDRAYDYLNSFYIQEKNYYIEYFVMRKQQYYRLKSMREFIKLEFLKEKEVKLLKEFTDNFGPTTKVQGQAKGEMKKLNEIKHHFTDEASIPRTRGELQNRVALHHYLDGLENIVEIKMHFVQNYEREYKQEI